MKKTLLFDLDGTLIDSTSAILASFDFAFQSFDKKPASHEDITRLIGLPLDKMFAKLRVNEGEIAAFIKAYKQNYEKIYLAQTTLLPLAKEALECAFSFADVGVVTTKTSLFSKNLLEYLGVGGFIKCVVGREDVREPKPSAEPILKALELLQKDKNTAFMIGDTHIDIEAARNAGIKCVAVSCGYEKEVQNDLLAPNAFEAVKLIKEFD